MATSTRWGGFRPDPYNPNAVDADSDGIVQEGTLFERPAGTRFINLDGTEIRQMLRGDNLTALSGLRLVGEDGRDVEYRQSWRAGQLSLGQRVGTIESTGILTVGQRTGVTPPRAIPRMAPPRVSPQDISIPEKYGGSRGLSDLREEFPELFDRDGNIRSPFRPRFQPHGFAGGVNDLLRGAETWAEVKDRLRGKTIVAYDYETTGFVDQGGRAVQIGAVKIVDGEVVDRFNVYINPGVPFDEWSQFSKDNLKWRDGSLLTQDRLSEFPTSKEAHQDFLRWIGDDEFYMMGHNAFSFDDRLLEIESNNNGIDQPNAAGRIDTWSLAADINSELGDDAPTRSNALTSLADALGIDLGDKAHTADADSEATGKLLFRLLDLAEERGVSTDIVNPDIALERENERRNKYDSDMERYNRALSIYNEIMDHSAKKKAAARPQRREDRAPVERTDTPSAPSDVTPETINNVSNNVSQIITNELKDDTPLVIPGVVGNPLDIGDYGTFEVLINVDENGNLLGPSAEGLAAVEDVQRVGASVRTAVLERIRNTSETKEIERRLAYEIEQLDKLSQALSEAERPSIEYIDNLSIERFGKPYNDLTSNQKNVIYEALSTDRQYDSLTMAALSAERAYNAQRERVDSHRLEMRKIFARELFKIIHGKEGFGRKVEDKERITFTNNIELIDIPEENREQIQRSAQAAWDALPEQIRDMIADSSYGSEGIKLKLKYDPDIDVGGNYSGEGEPLEMIISLSSSTIGSEDDQFISQVIFHEYLHAAQANSPELFRLEQAFAAKRLGGTPADSAKENSVGFAQYEDLFNDPYSGTIVPNSEGEGMFFEIITASLDGVFFPHSGSDGDVPDDDQFDFALGALLAVTRSEGREEYFSNRTDLGPRYGREDTPTPMVDVDTSPQEISEEVERLNIPGADPISDDGRSIDELESAAKELMDSDEFKQAVSDIKTVIDSIGEIEPHNGEAQQGTRPQRSVIPLPIKRDLTDEGAEIWKNVHKNGKELRKAFSLLARRASLLAMSDSEKERIREAWKGKIEQYRIGSGAIRTEIITPDIDEMLNSLKISSGRKKKIRKALISQLNEEELLYVGSKRSLAVGRSPDTISADINERIYRIYRQLSITEKSRFRDTSLFKSDEERAIMQEALSSIGDKLREHEIRTLHLGEGPEADLIRELDATLKTEKGENYRVALRRSRRQASREFFKSINSGFGTGKLRVDTTELGSELSDEEISFLISELENSLPVEWVDAINAAGFKIKISDRGYMDMAIPPHTDSDGNLMPGKVGVIALSAYGVTVSREDYLEELLETFIHEAGHAASSDYYMKPDSGPTLSSRLKGQRTRNEIAQIIVARHGNRRLATRIDDDTPDEFTFMDGDGINDDVKYTFKAYTPRVETTQDLYSDTEIFSMLSEKYFNGMGFGDSTDFDPELEDALFGALVAGLGGETSVLEEDEYSLMDTNNIPSLPNRSAPSARRTPQSVPQARKQGASTAAKRTRSGPRRTVIRQSPEAEERSARRGTFGVPAGVDLSDKTRSVMFTGTNPENKAIANKTQHANSTLSVEGMNEDGTFIEYSEELERKLDERWEQIGVTREQLGQNLRNSALIALGFDPNTGEFDRDKLEEGLRISKWYSTQSARLRELSESRGVDIDQLTAAATVLSAGRVWDGVANGNYETAERLVDLLQKDEPIEINKKVVDFLNWRKKKGSKSTSALGFDSNLKAGSTVKPSDLDSAQLVELLYAINSMRAYDSLEAWLVDSKNGEKSPKKNAKVKPIYPLFTSKGTLQVKQAVSLLRGDVTAREGISGPKYSSFFSNLRRPDLDYSSTNDTWHYRVMAGNLTINPIVKGLPPMTMQELTIKDRSPRKDKKVVTAQDIFQNGLSSSADGLASGDLMFRDSTRITRQALEQLREDYPEQFGDMKIHELQALVWVFYGGGKTSDDERLSMWDKALELLPMME